MASADIERQRFNEWAATYEHSVLQWLVFNRVHRAVLRRLPAGFVPASILDLGCGTGRLLRRMHARWPQAALIGVDQSDRMVAISRRLTPEAAFYQASAERIPLGDDTLDLVTTTMSFHHWSDQAQGVSEVFRLLHRGGVFVLADANIGHGSPLSRKQVKELLQASGFSVLRQSSIVPYLTITYGKKA